MIELTNDKACNLFKYDKSELLESNVNMLLPENLRATHTKKMQDFFNLTDDATVIRIVEGVTKNNDFLQFNISIEVRKIVTEGETIKFAVV